MNHKKLEWQAVGWINLAQDRYQQQAVVNIVVDVSVP
jgi:hypothetical protein